MIGCIGRDQFNESREIILQYSNGKGLDFFFFSIYKKS
jgi:hypothetical protein